MSLIDMDLLAINKITNKFWYQQFLKSGKHVQVITGAHWFVTPPPQAKATSCIPADASCLFTWAVPCPAPSAPLSGKARHVRDGVCRNCCPGYLTPHAVACDDASYKAKDFGAARSVALRHCPNARPPSAGAARAHRTWPGRVVLRRPVSAEQGRHN